MPTDPRPVVPGLELRERLCQQLDRLTGQMLAPIVVDAILAEIAAAGLSIVATDRLERLNDVGTHALAYWEYRFANVIASDRVRDLPDKARLLGLACMLLEDGDLDPLAGGDR